MGFNPFKKQAIVLRVQYVIAWKVCLIKGCENYLMRNKNNFRRKRLIESNNLTGKPLKLNVIILITTVDDTITVSRLL